MVDSSSTAGIGPTRRTLRDARGQLVVLRASLTFVDTDYRISYQWQCLEMIYLLLTCICISKSRYRCPRFVFIDDDILKALSLIASLMVHYIGKYVYM